MEALIGYIISHNVPGVEDSLKDPYVIGVLLAMGQGVLSHQFAITLGLGDCWFIGSYLPKGIQDIVDKQRNSKFLNTAIAARWLDMQRCMIPSSGAYARELITAEQVVAA